MRALALTPGVAGSGRIVDAPEPVLGPGQVKLRMQLAGICGTDAEILAGLYGEAPAGSDYLILGHESIGRVVAVGDGVEGFSSGDYVVPIVRRPDDCPNCRRGEYDFCSKGDYRERGIKGLHGFMAEDIVEDAAYLVPVPAALRDVAVLIEPTSIVEKAIAQAFRVQSRLYWEPRRALVLGAGPVGLLATLLLRLRGIETYTLATRPPGSRKAVLAEASGAHYVDATAHPVDRFPAYVGKPDLVIDATGNSGVAFEALGVLAPNGVLVLTSVTGGDRVAQLPIDRLNLQLVLGNQVVLGSINANRTYFEAGVRDFGTIQSRWPGLLSKLITSRFPLEDWRHAFDKDRDAVKTVLEIAAE